MSFRNTASQYKHDAIVRRLFDELFAKGYENVRAAHLELAEDSEPEKIYCEKAEIFFCPDLYAEKDGCIYFFEVETEDSIEFATTRAELECIAMYAKTRGGYFYVVVPEKIRETTKSILDTLAERDQRKTFILAV
jgi:Holliday junction resolvase